MSAKTVATEAQIRRAINAVQKAGLSIAGVRADGTIIVGEPSPSMVSDHDDKWKLTAHRAVKWNKPGTK